MRSRTYGAVIAVGALLASAAACASPSAGDAEREADRGTRTIRPVEGCGETSWTPPTDRSPTRAPARCRPGTPAAQPLPEPQKLTIATGTLSAEYVAPLQVALDKGEFEKEGLDITLKVLPTPDALPLLAKGDIDALWAAPEAAVMNGVRSGFDIRWVAGNFSPDPKSRSGLWVRLKDDESADRVAMAGRKLGTMIGKGSVIAYPMEKALERHGGGLDRIQYQQLGSADVLTALQNGGVDSAWLLDPVWRRVDGEPGYAFLGGQPLGEPLGGMLYGPNLLDDDADAGVALLRAYIRTVNTYFASDYKKDETFVTYLAKLLKADEAILESTPSLRMDWEIRTGTTDRLQSAYRAQGVTEDDPLPERTTVDRSLYEEAVGHRPQGT
ncbi:ABC transporter substrate-binding protein [Streptomyces sp. ALI-76-A]|uniref:ABC transporter substrate-binding protein n=1 Tax=Streptomyces sp. ALI-76-A TaxID=3025736 RepID=UPI00256EDDC4|nr:ABC transporter substrate-binding protein [Streptomyces sp. ALI-76-A]MDL5203701.1 ABC transporter substrate-binding protein [Streptomyces sp. ALI-76-A]